MTDENKDSWPLYHIDIKLMARCFYKKKYVDEVGDIWVCIIHGQNSKHHSDNTQNLEESILPCLVLDPWAKLKEEE